MMSDKYIIGFDLGTTSIGWACIGLDEEFQPDRIIDAGVRLFPLGVNAKDQVSLCAIRRSHRGKRRMHWRRNERRYRLTRLLREHGLLPESHEELSALLRTEDPYQLRAKGLSDRLTLMQFGRGLYHLNQRRGFKSNRKTSKELKKEDAKKEKKCLDGIKSLDGDISASQAETLGQFLADMQVQAKQAGVRGRSYDNVFCRE